MSKNLSPQEKDRMATAARQQPGSVGEASPERDTPTWLWTMVALIVLVSFAAGGIAGFLGGRLYERRHLVISPDLHWLIGARLADEGEGVYFRAVYPGGPAHLAGLQDGDRLVSIDGEVVNSAGQAERILAPYAPGDAVVIAYERSHRYATTTLILGFGPPIRVTVVPIIPLEPPVIAPYQDSIEEGRLGVYYRMLKPGDPFAVREGALIVSILGAGTPAERAGLLPGDIITRVGSESLDSSNTLEDALNRFSAGDRVTLQVNRAGKNLAVTVTLAGS